VQEGRPSLQRHLTARDRLVFALDYPTIDAARAAARALRGHVGAVKVGLELYVAHGPAALALGREANAPVFLDLKLHDIPETVGRAVASAARAEADVHWLTVHASGGPAMLRAALENAPEPLRIVAVTVLTSLDAGDLAALGIAGAPEEQARRLARLAFDVGVRTFVCSPAEAAALRAELGRTAQIITPGVRSAGSEPGDQKRVATAAAAIASGADLVVVGRPIRDAADPAVAADAIVAEMAGG
jgi:orotidine-5'-phosphate decarboxylase